MSSWAYEKKKTDSCLESKQEESGVFRTECSLVWREVLMSINCLFLGQSCWIMHEIRHTWKPAERGSCGSVPQPQPGLKGTCPVLNQLDWVIGGYNMRINLPVVDIRNITTCWNIEGFTPGFYLDNLTFHDGSYNGCGHGFEGHTQVTEQSLRCTAPRILSEMWRQSLLRGESGPRERCDLPQAMLQMCIVPTAFDDENLFYESSWYQRQGSVLRYAYTQRCYSGTGCSGHGNPGSHDGSQSGSQIQWTNQGFSSPTHHWTSPVHFPPPGSSERSGVQIQTTISKASLSCICGKFFLVNSTFSAKFSLILNFVFKIPISGQRFLDWTTIKMDRIVEIPVSKPCMVTWKYHVYSVLKGNCPLHTRAVWKACQKMLRGHPRLLKPTYVFFVYMYIQALE